MTVYGSQQEGLPGQAAEKPGLLFGEKQPLTAEDLRWQECLICGVRCEVTASILVSCAFGLVR